MRGGIAIGTLYHKEKLALGWAMIRAYEIESTVACMPRVVVDEKVVKAARSIVTRQGVDRGVDAASLLKRDLISRDRDGCWIIDPFSKDRDLRRTAPNWDSVVREHAAEKREDVSRPKDVAKDSWLSKKLKGVGPACHARSD